MVVTGGTDGIGKVFVKEMYNNGAIVIFSGRSILKALTLIKELEVGISLDWDKDGEDKIISLNRRLIFKKVDQADLNSVQTYTKFVKTFLEGENLGRIDYLFNNAGLLGMGLRKTKQDMELNVGVNFVSHVVITD